MRAAVFSSKPYDVRFLGEGNASFGHDLEFFEARLDRKTAALARGFPAVCCFVNDELDAPALGELAKGGTGLIALRSAGFNNVDLIEAHRLGIRVARVPAYSPHAVAEHTIGLILTLDRKIHRAYNQVRDGNFSLNSLLGFDLFGRTAGVVGTGSIGAVVVRILRGFGVEVLACDPEPRDDLRESGVEYVPLRALFERSDIVTLHCPLVPETRHLVNAEAIASMKTGVMLINTSRGGLIDTRAVISGLKSGKIGYLGLDVYEEEADLFFQDLSERVIQDDVFSRLLTFPNVVITGHQAFFTREAMESIARVTLENLAAFEAGRTSGNEVTPERVVR